MRRVEVGAKLCLQTLASATSDKFCFIFGQYLLAGIKCFPWTSFIFGLLPLQHISDASFTYIIMLWNTFIQISPYQYSVLTLGKLKAQEVIIFLENNLKLYRFYLTRGPNVWKLRQFWKKKKKKYIYIYIYIYWITDLPCQCKYLFKNSLGYFFYSWTDCAIFKFMAHFTT